MRTGGERRSLVEELARPGDHSCASLGVIRTARRQVTKRVGSIERVVQRTPPCVRGIDRVASVHDRHDELRSGNRRQLGVDIGRVDAEVRTLGLQIAELFEEGPVGSRVVGLPDPLLVPAVDRRLEFFPALEQFAVAGCKVSDQSGETGPEVVGIDAGVRKCLVHHEVVEFLSYGESVSFDTGLIGARVGTSGGCSSHRPRLLLTEARERLRGSDLLAGGSSRVS